MKDEVGELTFSIYPVAVKLLYEEILMSLVHSGHWVTAGVPNGTRLVGKRGLH